MKNIGSRAVNLLVASAVTAMLSPVYTSFAAVNNDEVTSVKLKEADASSGQNTNTGSGVKTGHIQDRAVTAAKISDATITATQLANGAVTASKIAAGSVDSNALSAGAVTNDKLAAGISTDKLAGTIGVDKLGTFAGIKIVHSGPINGVDTFNSINAAIQASARGGFIKVMPGTYDEVINLTKYVVIEGSGKDVTLINAQASGPNSGCDSIMLKNLTINGVSSWCGVNAENLQSNGMLWVAWTALNLDNVVINGSAISLGSVNINNTTINGGELHISGGAYNSQNVSNTVIHPAAGQSAAIFVFNTVSPNNPPQQPLVFTNVHVGDGANEGVNLGQGVWVKFINSTVKGSNFGANIGNSYDLFEAYNSKIIGGIGSLTGVYSNAQPVKIANSQLNAGETYANSVKTVNCYDTNLAPIANQ